MMIWVLKQANADSLVTSNCAFPIIFELVFHETQDKTAVISLSGVNSPLFHSSYTPALADRRFTYIVPAISTIAYTLLGVDLPRSTSLN